MTPVFCCGFECTGDRVHWTLNNGGTIVSTTVRSGNRALKANPVATTNFIGGNVIAEPLVTSQHHIARFYVYFASLPTTNAYIGYFSLSGGNRSGVAFKQSDSKLYVATGSAVFSFGASGVSVTTGQWYLIDLYSNNSANPWVVNAKVNGTALGQATIATGAASDSTQLYLASESLGASHSSEIYWDDVIISKTGADYPIGAGYVNDFIPTSDGTHNVAGAGDFKHGTGGTDILNSTTDAYTLVNDAEIPTGTPNSSALISAIAPPNATDYVECVFGPGAGINTPTAGPRAVECVIATHQAGTQTGSFKVNLNDNGTTGLVYEQAGAAGSTSFQYFTKQFATAPTGGAWGVAAGNGNFNNIRCRFYSADAAPDQYLDAIMIEAEFAEATGPVSITSTMAAAFAQVSTLKGKASLTSTQAAAFGSALTLKLITKLTMTAASAFAQVASLVRISKLSTTIAAAFAEIASIKGRASLSSTSAASFSQISSLKVGIKLTMTTAAVFAQTASIKAITKISATIASAFNLATATLKGRSRLTSTTASVFAETASLKGRASLSMTSASSFAVIANLKAIMRITSTIASVFAQTATLKVRTALTLICSPAFSVISSLKGRSGISSTIASVFAEIANLRNRASLTSTTASVFAETANLKNISSLSVVSASSFLVIPTLKGISSLTSVQAASFSVVSSVTGSASLTTTVQSAFSTDMTLKGIAGMTILSNPAFNFSGDLTVFAGGTASLTSEMPCNFNVDASLSLTVPMTCTIGTQKTAIQMAFIMKV